MKRKYILYIFIGILSLIILAVGVRYALYQGYIRLNYPSLSDYPVQGIDVSHHQGLINWSELDKEIIKFAFIKATEGGDHKDTLFQYNWEQARLNNITRGAYHYFSFCKSGSEQAKNYMESVPKDSSDLPPIVDLEFGGNCSEANRVGDLIAEIEKYITILEAHYRKPVIIYSTYDFYDVFLSNKFKKNPIWIRDIMNTPNLIDNRAWHFWQYTNRGQMKGVDTRIDLNVFNGSERAFYQFVRDTLQ